MQRFLKIICALALALLTSGQASAQQPDPQSAAAPAKTKGSFKDPTDGWFDLSGYLENPGGFFPVVMPITEPAVGYGLALFPVFLRPRTEAGAQGYILKSTSPDQFIRALETILTGGLFAPASLCTSACAGSKRLASS
jgi:hypothetical protein